MKQRLKDKFSIPDAWDIIQGETKEKERINQSTETTQFTATSPDGNTRRTFEHIHFSDHRGSKEWSNETT